MIFWGQNCDEQETFWYALRIPVAFFFGGGGEDFLVNDEVKKEGK